MHSFQNKTQNSVTHFYLFFFCFLLRSLSDIIDPSKLIPALVRYSQQLQTKSNISKARKEKERRLLIAQQRLGKNTTNMDEATNNVTADASSNYEMSYAIKYLDYCVR